MPYPRERRFSKISHGNYGGKKGVFGPHTFRVWRRSSVDRVLAQHAQALSSIPALCKPGMDTETCNSKHSGVRSRKIRNSRCSKLLDVVGKPLFLA